MQLILYTYINIPRGQELLALLNHQHNSLTLLQVKYNAKPVLEENKTVNLYANLNLLLTTGRKHNIVSPKDCL